MKPIALKTMILAVLIFLGLGTTASAARLFLAPGSSLWLTGDSTLHVYGSTATALSASGEMDVQKPFPAGAIEDFKLTVPVKGLKSGEAGLDKNLWKALKAEDDPEIIFRLSRLAAEPDPSGGFRLKAAGTLSIAGREQAVTLEAKTSVDAARFVIEGEQELLMTDYGVKPPVMMLGAIKTKNEITVHYRIILNVGEDNKEAIQ